ncbi:MAG: Holliday junction resolvase RuvX [Gammaproteobacteria bacterium]|nr:Holliday junction resolvase RuvX [Gammaproteobacteria bacterium]
MSRHTTLLGFDFGDKRIGVAVGQTLTGTATALTTVAMHQQKPDWPAITRLVNEWQPDALVVGIPLTMTGDDQPLTDRAKAFARRLEGRYHLPVYGVDERLSSHAARNNLRSTHEVDSEAARIILETWLSEHDRNTAPDSNLPHQR